MTERLVFAIGVPVVVVLIVSVILVERVVEVSIEPKELWNNTQVEWHLGVIIRLVVVSRSDGVEFLVKVRVDDGVSPVVVSLLPIVLWEV